ncbi:hypothetical protein ACLB2K_016767 [Fragaria x ananassa]
MAPTKSKILCSGGTGYIGKLIVEASVKAGHSTSVAHSLQPVQVWSHRHLQGLGDLNDHESLVKAIKKVDVVISTVGYSQLADQGKIIAAVKEAGNVKRFFPSEFGNDVDRAHAVEPAKTAFAMKAKFRRDTEAGIPYTATHVSSNL